MKLATALRLALAETRRSRGALAFCVLSIALGVMALTAVRSVTLALEESLTSQARGILGADLLLSGNQPLNEGVAAGFAQELEASGARAARGTRFYSMLSRGAAREKAPTSKSTELVHVRAVSDGFPFYGSLATVPADAFARLGDAPSVIVDPSTARDLGLVPGDTVGLGELEARVLGSFVKRAGSPASEFSLAPLLFLHERHLPATGLLTTGSRIRYERLFALPEHVSAEDWKEAHFDQAMELGLNLSTSREAAGNVRRFLSRLSNFTTVVGLITLFLGALGIGSALRAFMQHKLDHAAILRCLGASPRDLLLIYGLLALGLGAAGSVLGAVVGALLPLGLSGALSSLAGDFLPADLDLQPSVGPLWQGVLSGIVASAAFTLVPLWRTSTVPPLRVLRHDAEGSESAGRRRWALALGLGSALGCSLLLSVAQTASWRVGVWFTLSIALGLGLLALSSRVLLAFARWLGPRLGRYLWRQGIANLHRPGNQTLGVLVAVGMGFLLLSSLLIVQASLEQSIALDEQGDLPNLFVVDIQPDQALGVQELLSASSATRVTLDPMITARLGAVNGQAIARRGVERDGLRRTWEDRLRTREYRVSYRDALIPSEELTQGTFWQGRPERQEISLDAELAENLGLSLGDTLTLDIQGLPLDGVVTSFREIRWQALRPNAMVLLSPGEIEQAPKTFVGSLRLVDRDERYALQRALVDSYPNLSVIDATEAAGTVLLIVGRISTIFSALGGLTLFIGTVILVGAIASGRKARQREAMLLKVLGASRSDLRRILTTEYAALAAFGILGGWFLAEALGRLGLPALFETPPVVPYALLGALGLFTFALNTGLGVLVGRSVSRQKPLDVLREE